LGHESEVRVGRGGEGRGERGRGERGSWERGRG
jgi:hypothetical protein